MPDALAELIYLNTQAGEYYFSPATQEFFGSSHMHAVRLSDGRFAYWELQENAPVQPYWIGKFFYADGKTDAAQTLTATSEKAICKQL